MRLNWQWKDEHGFARFEAKVSKDCYVTLKEKRRPPLVGPLYLLMIHRNGLPEWDESFFARDIRDAKRKSRDRLVWLARGLAPLAEGS